MNGSVKGVLATITRSALLLTAAGLFLSASNLDGQTGTLLGPQSQSSTVDVLSDTQGVDFGPYIRQAMAMIKKNIPEEARSPATQGGTLIRFSVFPDGRVSAMHLDGSSQHTNIDRAAWGAITGVGQFPALPAEFKGPYLELRISFFTNRSLSAPVTP